MARADRPLGQGAPCTRGPANPCRSRDLSLGPAGRRRVSPAANQPPAGCHQAQAVDDAVALRGRTMPWASQARHPVDPSVPLGFWEKWSPAVQLRILVYFGSCYVALCLLPNQIWSQDALEFVYVIGLLGLWRYTWWL